MGVPTFCSIHLKIHECPENSNKAILSATENKIKAKMNRMLNPTAASNEPVKPIVAEKGTIQYILANAKKKNDNIKNKLGIENNNENNIKINENDIKAKMARLRASIINGQQVGDTTENISPSPTLTNKEDAKDNNENNEDKPLKVITFDDNVLDQLNVEMQENQLKKTVSNASKQKKSTYSRTKGAQTRAQQPSPNNSNNKNNAVEPTITLTATEIEALIEKAVIKAIAKENSKKKRG